MFSWANADDRGKRRGEVTAKKTLTLRAFIDTHAFSRVAAAPELGAYDEYGCGGDPRPGCLSTSGAAGRRAVDGQTLPTYSTGD
mmetsp:Transcript_31349/g.70971  ORF Transcript_31349/g.70971 Transcript_31349/m.70971 type:complete len:84 (-) Transcript_31349:12-263(-)